MKAKNYHVLIYYLMAAIFLYPVIAHIVMYQMGFMIDKLPHGQIWLYIQIFISGPALIIIGLMLYLKYSYKTLNKLLGCLMILIGIYWLGNLISEIIKEAA